jgi:predicted nucleic acid-binding protein
MIRVFFDSSVLFSAMYSSKGYSHDLLIMALRNTLQMVISQLVIDEVKRNLYEISPELSFKFLVIIQSIPAVVVRPSKEEVLNAAKVVAFKDAPIIAAGKIARVDLLVSLDKKHILNKPNLVDYAGVDIVTPAEAIKVIKKDFC